jgi:gamma-glutamylcyclotransferase (GGCT)/AIG2-like uncharacterized protein YtfP
MKIAVYGTLREGHGNHGCLMGSPLVGTCQVYGFDMVTLGGFPAVDFSQDKERGITVEVYECDDEAVARCNRLEGYDPTSTYDSFYGRTTIMTEFGEAEMYYIDKVLEEGYERIESGDWADYTGQKRAAYAA